MKAELTKIALENRISWNKNINRNCTCIHCTDQIRVEEEIEELERLAEIGRATEKTFEDGKYITDASCKTLANIGDLLDWAKED